METMNTNNKPLIYGVIAVLVVVILFLLTRGTPNKEVAVVPNTPAVTPTATTPAKTPTDTSSGSSVTKPVVYTTPAKPTSGSFQIHLYRGGPAVYYSPTTTISDMIKVYNPPTNTAIASPLTISGMARGPWFFEATAPVLLTDAKGKIIAKSYIRAQSNYMTNELVPYLGTLTFPPQPSGSTGVLVLRKDNPSGISSYDASIEILVSF